jgi:hypothetical protein
MQPFAVQTVDLQLLASELGKCSHQHSHFTDRFRVGKDSIRKLDSDRPPL